ncbi:MAG TPA: ABC transporter permease [Acidimicrobiales bacterium]|nr:ABC transporter permease [Acidimicrobiales bacterium]
MSRPTAWPLAGLVAVRSLGRQRGRSAAIMAGVALGVAINFGVSIANASTTAMVHSLTQALAGNSQVLVRPLSTDRAGLDPALAPRIERLAGVNAIQPEMQLAVEVDNPAPGPIGVPRGLGEELRGADWGSTTLDSIPLVAGRLPSTGAEEIVLPSAAAARIGVSVGTPVVVHFMTSTARMTVVGLAGGGGPELADPGYTAFAPMAPARALGGPSTGLADIQVGLASGVDPTTWVHRHSGELGPGVQAVVSANAYSDSADTLRALGGALDGTAGVALFVGMFLVYLTMSTRVLERTRTLGLMYALGTSRRQVVGMVLAEAVAIGLVGSAIGVLVGFAVGAGLVHMTPNLIGSVPNHTTVPLVQIPLSILAGLGMVVIGALVPARRAGRLSPVEALKADHEPDRRRSPWWIAGAAVIAAGLALRPEAGLHPSIVLLAVGLILLGAVLVVPALLRPLATVVGRLTRRASPVIGSIAVLHLSRERNRSAYTLSLVMVVMAMALAVASGVTSIRSVLDREARAQLVADVRIFGIQTPAGLALVRQTPGVAASTAIYRVPSGDYLAARPTQSSFMQLIDPTTYFSAGGFAFTSGDARSARAALQAGNGVLVPTSIAHLLNLQAGSPIELETALGPRPFVVGGVFISQINSPGLVLSYAEGQTYYNASGISEVDAVVQPGTNVAVLASTLNQKMIDRVGYGIGWQTMAQLRAMVDQNINAIAGMLMAVLGVAGGIGLLGLANTLVMSVISRTREIGLLQALGTDRRGIGLMVLTETATLCGAAFVLSLVLAALLNGIVDDATLSTLAVRSPSPYPWSFVPVVAVVSAVAALAASVPPIRRSLRLSPALALRVD